MKSFDWVKVGQKVEYGVVNDRSVWNFFHRFCSPQQFENKEWKWRRGRIVGVDWDKKFFRVEPEEGISWNWPLPGYNKSEQDNRDIDFTELYSRPGYLRPILSSEEVTEKRTKKHRFCFLYEEQIW